MIPKTLHYVWLGGNPLPAQLSAYIDGWRKMMPDWEIVRWDESNFQSGGARYYQEALDNRKWAFASDYVRVKVLFEHGGIYLDTDVEVVKPLDRFREHAAFFGMETSMLGCQLMGCQPGNECFGRIVRYYDNLTFVQPDGSFDQRIIGTHIGGVLAAHYGFEPRDERQELSAGGGDEIVVYPSRYFCPDLATLRITEESYAIHRPSGSWITPRDRLRSRLYKFITAVPALRWLHVHLWRRVR